MSIRVVGNMTYPCDSSPAANSKIGFLSLAGYLNVPKGISQDIVVATDGSYDFTLEFGSYSVSVNSTGKPVNQGKIVVNEDTPSVVDFNQLMSFSTPLTPPEIIYVEELVKQAEAARDASAGFAIDSQQSAANSANEAVKATSEADRAKSEADRATEVTGLDTVEEAVDMALGEIAGLMSESEARAIQKQNEITYAASGIVHAGKDVSASSITAPVNEGMWTRVSGPSDSNVLYLGRSGGSGSSKTDFPVTHIAGSVINILGIGSDLNNIIQLPPAEDGTRIYDSTGDARGSGEASLDLKVDVDPKYGNAPTGTEAQILREGIGRAFEGYCINGEFRLGNDGGWFLTGAASIATGVATVPVSSSIWRTSPIAYVDGKDYEVEVHVENVVGNPLFRHTTFKNDSVLTDGLNKFTFKFNATQDVNPRYQVLTTANDSCSVISVAVHPVTEQVVTHPVDLLMWEYYEEELTGRKEVMECPQSLSTTFGDTDVPTVLSTRPLSYFQQYDGQFADPALQNDRYRCVVWDDLTEVQKRKVAAYMGEKLFVGENGNIVNGRLRARTIRGLGNGDWNQIDSTQYNAILESSTGGRVAPHGVDDAPSTALSKDFYVGTDYPSRNLTPTKGAFTAQSSVNGYKGRCFAYVVATVPRACKAAFVKGLNEFGTGKLTGNKFWYELAPSDLPKTVQDTFTMMDPNTGAIGQSSGHPDGLFYDEITAGGLNGVIDWRLPAIANDSPEEGAKAWGKVKNGTYRGLDKLLFTKVYKATVNSAGTYSGGGYFKVAEHTDMRDVFSTKRHSFVYNETKGVVLYISCFEPSGNTYVNTNPVVSGLINQASSAGGINIDAYKDTDVGDIVYFIAASELNLSVSGEFNTSMVIGDPADLVQVDALKDGWLGTWCDVIPNGGLAGEFTRKAIASPATWAQSANFGVAWLTGSRSVDLVQNVISLNPSVGTVTVIYYKAFSKQTTPSVVKPVLNANAGLLGVLVTQDYSKSTLSEAVAGIIMKSNSSGIITESATPVKFLIDDMVSRIKTLATDMVAPANNSQAIKVAVYQISGNGQCKLGFIANTMTHNGTDWGERDEIQIPVGVSEDTFPDENGVTQRAVSSISAIPHGWTNNHARAGTQVPGVDL